VSIVRVAPLDPQRVAVAGGQHLDRQAGGHPDTSDRTLPQAGRGPIRYS
jgi:hypothetical protein